MPGTDRKTIFHELPVFTEHGALHNFIPSINFIIENWMSQVFHMHPDLVSATGFEFTLYEGDISETFQHLVMSNGFFAIISFRVGFKEFPEALVPAHMGHDGAVVFFKVAPCHGHVMSFNGMIKKLFRKTGNGPLCFRQYHQPAGVLIDSVYQAKARQNIFIQTAIFLQKMKCNAVDQGAIGITAGGMHYQPYGFIDDQYLFILMYNVQGYWFRPDLLALHFLIG